MCVNRASLLKLSQQKVNKGGPLPRIVLETQVKPFTEWLEGGRLFQRRQNKVSMNCKMGNAQFVLRHSTNATCKWITEYPFKFQENLKTRTMQTISCCCAVRVTGQSHGLAKIVTMRSCTRILILARPAIGEIRSLMSTSRFDRYARQESHGQVLKFRITRVCGNLLKTKTTTFQHT